MSSKDDEYDYLFKGKYFLILKCSMPKKKKWHVIKVRGQVVTMKKKNTVTINVINNKKSITI